MRLKNHVKQKMVENCELLKQENKKMVIDPLKKSEPA